MIRPGEGGKERRPRRRFRPPAPASVSKPPFPLLMSLLLLGLLLSVAERTSPCPAIASAFQSASVRAGPSRHSLLHREPRRRPRILRLASAAAGDDDATERRPPQREQPPSSSVDPPPPPDARGLDDATVPEEILSEADSSRGVRAAYFTRTSGFAVGDGGGGDDDDDDAIASMADLERSFRTSLARRIEPHSPGYASGPLRDEWMSQDDAAGAARLRASAKRGERTRKFVESIRQRREEVGRKESEAARRSSGDGAAAAISEGGQMLMRERHRGFGTSFADMPNDDEAEQLKRDMEVKEDAEESDRKEPLAKDFLSTNGIKNEENEDTTLAAPSGEDQAPSASASVAQPEAADKMGTAAAEAEATQKQEAEAETEAREKAAVEAKAEADDKARAKAADEARAAEEAEEQAKAEAAEEAKEQAKAEAAAAAEEAAAKATAEKEEAEAAAAAEEAAANATAEKEEAAKVAAEAKAAAESEARRIAEFESTVKPLRDKATGVEFPSKLDEGLYLAGVGVRKKAILNIYAAALYAPPAVKEEASSISRSKDKKAAKSAFRAAARACRSPSTTLVLEMVFAADAKTIAGAIADGVKPRHAAVGGSAGDVAALEALIFDGVKAKGGKATKGTTFRFDCTTRGVGVSVDGNLQGEVTSENIGAAFADVFLDDKAVSPALVESCMQNWCGP